MGASVQDDDVFRDGAWVMHRNHGVGRVNGAETVSVGGSDLKMLLVDFENPGMTLRVPLARVAASGLRPVCDRRTMEAALAVLGERPKVGRGIWAKRAKAYEEKLASGEPSVVAAVLRDLGCHYNSAHQSTSERQLVERAIHCLASEIAVIDGTTRIEAAQRVVAMLSAREAAAERVGLAA